MAVSTKPPAMAKRPGLRPIVRHYIWRFPYLYWAIGVLRQRRNIFSSNFDILVDGFPRSANTFTIMAFRRLYPHIRVSGHNHNPAAIIAALWMEKPALVLVRKPIDAVVSWSLFSGYPLEYNIDSYIDYYEILMPYKDRLCITTFEEITASYDVVIERINRRYGTDLTPRRMHSADEKAVFEEVEKQFSERVSFIDDMRIERPSTKRMMLKESLVEWLSHEQHIVERLAKADAIYEEFAGARDTFASQPHSRCN